MAEGVLPEGLISSNTEAVSEGMESVDRVDVEDIARLWRAYSTNKNLLGNDVGQRLEYFFWRIWASGRVQDSLQGAHVALLFERISQGEIIRTTPIPSPRSSRIMSRSPLPELQTALSSSSSAQDIGPEHMLRDEPTDRTSQPPTIEEEKGRRRSSARPPAILKKPGIESGSKKTATILTPTWKTRANDPAHDEADESWKTTPKASSLSLAETAVADDEPQSPASRENAKAAASQKGKKRPSFVVGAASSKRRPALGRRKSSQTSSSGSTSKVPSPKLDSASPPATSSRSSMRFIPLSEEPRRQARRPTSRSVSPVSSSPFKRPPRDHLPIRESPKDADSAPLVSRDFRSSFVEKVRMQGGSLMKTAATSSFSTSFQATGSSFTSYEESTGKGKGKEIADEEEDLANLTLSKLPSQVLEDDDDDDGGGEEESQLKPVPRAISQLSMLLKGDHQSQADQKKKESSTKGKGRGKKGK